MDILNFIKKIDIPTLVLNGQGEPVFNNYAFENLFEINIVPQNIQKFKNSFSIQSCMLYPENIVNYNPINLAIEANGNFRTLATYQKSSEEFFNILISSVPENGYFVITFEDCSSDFRNFELLENLMEAKTQLETLKNENLRYLETKDKAQNQAIKMALLNRIFESLRQSIELDETLKLSFKELSEIFGFSKVGFVFNDNGKFEIKNIYPQKYENELSSFIDIDDSSLEKLNANKYVISNIAEVSDEKPAVSKPQCRLVFPIYHSNSLIGAIFGYFSNNNLNKMNNDMINAISAQFTSAIVQSYLFSELNEKNEQLQKAYTKLEQAQLQLVNSEKMASLGQLVAGVAHEINTPLASINSNNSIYEKIFESKEIDNDILETLVTMIETDKEAIKRISNIVKSLKRFVRLDEAEFQEADINKELDLTLELLKHETKKRIEIIKDYCESVEIKCFPNLLNQVFMNILMNAIQSIDGEGKIYLTTKNDNKNFTVIIKDTGVGMDEKTKKKIFKTGFTTKKVGIGTGLGLMISKDIVEKHSGSITFNSEKGIGTEFIITIPAK